MFSSTVHSRFICLFFVAYLFFVSALPLTHASYIATTTLSLSICGNSIVEPNEECDAPGETGLYSTNIDGRQCTPVCEWGPYCGDGILQSQYGEECDDGNNESGDFCSADCKIEPAGSGGGGFSGGGGGGSSGGSSRELGDTLISITGRAYPNQTVNILLDGQVVGTIRSNSNGNFEFTTAASPGTVSMGFWANDNRGTRSITFNNTFDVTQGAVTNVASIFLPPTLRVSPTQVDPGSLVTFSGQALPNVPVEIHIDGNQRVATTTSDSSGNWSLEYNTSGLTPKAYPVKARYTVGSTVLRTNSNFSSTVQLFVGVDGQSSTPADLNRDGQVNLIDFSILVFWWGSPGGDSDPPADINGDGTVGLADFSILLFNWSG